MNSILQEEQVDIHVIFWDSKHSLVMTRYFDSQFMYCANQDNLYQSITGNIEGLPETNMNQLLMDDHNTNRAVLKKFIGKKKMNQNLPSQVVAACILYLDL